MGRTCSTNRAEEESIQNTDGKARRKDTTRKAKEILKWILEI
jgi:hypothetical protein